MTPNASKNDIEWTQEHISDERVVLHTEKKSLRLFTDIVYDLRPLRRTCRTTYNPVRVSDMAKE